MEISEVISTCKFCNLRYNEISRQPRLIPNCGHAICKACIQLKFRQNEQKLFCPNEGCVMILTGKTFESFPINHTIIALMDADLSSIKEPEMVTRLPENEDSNLDDDFNSKCVQHNKRLAVICLDCKSKICYECGLFGIHKVHKMIPEADFNKKTADLYKSLKQIHKDVAKNENGFRKTHVRKQLLPFLVEKKNALNDQINESIEQLRIKIESFRSILLEENSKFFTHLEERISKLAETLSFEDELQNWKNKTRKAMDDFFSKQTELKAAFELQDLETKNQFIVNGDSLNKRLSDSSNQSQSQIRELMDRIIIEPKVVLMSDVLRVIFPKPDFEQTISSTPRHVDQSRKLFTTTEAELKLKPFIKKPSQQSIDVSFDEQRSVKIYPNGLRSGDYGSSPSYANHNRSLVNFGQGEYSLSVNDFKNDGKRSLLRPKMIESSTNLFPGKRPNRDLSTSPNHRSQQSLLTESNGKKFDIKRTSILDLEHLPSSDAFTTSYVNEDEIVIKKLMNGKNSQTISELLKGKCHILDLSISDIKDKDLVGLSSSISACKSLKSVKFVRNRISDDGVKILCSALSSSQVNHIDLSFNQISCDGAETILNFSKSNRKVKTVSLKGNRIDIRTQDRLLEDFRTIGVNAEF